MIKITTDSTADLNEIFLTRNIISFPLTVILGDKSYNDGLDIKPQDIYDYVAKTGILPKTAARNKEEYGEFFDKLTADGSSVIHFSISSGISSSYDHAQAAADARKNIYVVDSKSLSTGTGLLAMYAADLRDADNMTAQEIYEKCQARVPFVQASFVVDRMEYLYKGGRCTGLESFFATALKIKPSLLLRDGKITVGPKYMGNMLKSMSKYCNNIIDTYHNADKTRVFVTYTEGTAPEVIEKAKSIVRERINPAVILQTTAGSVITSHCGAGTLGILYINDAE